MQSIQKERTQEILKILKDSPCMRLEDLAKRVCFSFSTVRRDIERLESMGIVIRNKGRVSLLESGSKERHYQLRRYENTEAKEQIAVLAAEKIRDGMSLFLDSSSTALALCPHLSGKSNLTVITNGIETAYALMDYPLDIFFAGGYLRTRTSSILGEDTIAFLSRFNADIAFISCYGLSGGSATDPSYQQAVAKQQMLKNSRERYLLCNSAKFGREYKFRLASLTEFDGIYTEQEPNKAAQAELEAANCPVFYPFKSKQRSIKLA